MACKTCDGTGLIDLPLGGCAPCPDCRDGKVAESDGLESARREGRVKAEFLALNSYVSDGLVLVSDRNGYFGKVEIRLGGTYRLTEAKPEGK